jgi:cytochrome c oxidase cbb3-type subunit 4
METYTALRSFADSWALLAMTLFLIGMVAFVFRPAGRQRHRDAATSIFRNDDDRPAAAGAQPGEKERQS